MPFIFEDKEGKEAKGLRMGTLLDEQPDIDFIGPGAEGIKKEFEDFQRGQTDELELDELLKLLGLSGGGGGSTGRGRRGPTAIDIAQMKDRFHNMTMQMTGMKPEQLGVSFQWYRPKFEGGWSQPDFERFFRSTKVFKDAYPAIPDEMDIQSYNAHAVSFNQLSLEVRGKPLTEQELITIIKDKKVPF